MEGFDNREKEEVFSKVVRAGKRTYFFDVKATRKNDHYLTITESKKKFNDNGDFHYEKHKIFLYKEDFDKFTDGLEEVVAFIKATMAQNPTENTQKDIEEPAEVGAAMVSEFTNVEFEDLTE